MANMIARYYDRFGFRNNDQVSTNNHTYGKAVLRRGKVRYTTPALDALDLPQPVAMGTAVGIPRARRDPVIVVPIAKTKPVISSY
jgi:hypothetical protein